MEALNFVDDNIYLHHINLGDIKQVLNFLPGGGGYATPVSLDLNILAEIGADHQRIETARLQKEFYSLPEEELRHGLGRMDGISQSYRMQSLILASKFRNGFKVGQVNTSLFSKPTEKDGWLIYEMNPTWSNEDDEDDEVEKRIVDLSEIEIQFEIVRRQTTPESPSRITCLFLVEESFDGRLLLSNMFGIGSKNNYTPLILELGICESVMFTKADSEWYNKYFNDRKPEYIENYWSGIESDDPKWEVLLEGTVALINEEQRSQLKGTLKQFTRR